MPASYGTDSEFWSQFDNSQTIYFSGLQYSLMSAKNLTSSTLTTDVQGAVNGNGSLTLGIAGLNEGTDNTSASVIISMTVNYTPKVTVTIQNSFSGGQIDVDGTNRNSGWSSTSPQWYSGESHTIRAYTQPSGGITYPFPEPGIWTNVTTGETKSQTNNNTPVSIAPTSDCTWRANFGTGTASVMIMNSFNGGLVKVEGANVASGTSFPWSINSTHTLEAFNQDYQAPSEATYFRVYQNWNKQGDPGSTDPTNPKTVTITSASTYIANFAKQFNMSMTAASYVEGGSGGTYKLNGINVGSSYSWTMVQYNSATLEAVPPSNYVFIGWNDGSMQNPRTITPTDHTTLYALYKAHLASNNAQPTYGNAQQRITTVQRQYTPQLGYSYIEEVVVYESAGEIWTTSLNETTGIWSPEIRLSDGSGRNTYPSITGRGMYTNTRNEDVFVVWQNQRLDGQYDVHFAVRSPGFPQPHAIADGWIVLNPSNNYVGSIVVNETPCAIPPWPVISICQDDENSGECYPVLYRQDLNTIKQRFARCPTGTYFDAFFYSLGTSTITYSTAQPYSFSIYTAPIAISQPESNTAYTTTVAYQHTLYPEGLSLYTQDNICHWNSNRGMWLTTPYVVPASQLPLHQPGVWDPFYGTDEVHSPQVLRRNGKTLFAWIEEQYYDSGEYFMMVYQDRIGDTSWNRQCTAWEVPGDLTDIPASSVTLGNNGSQTELIWSAENTMYRAFKDGSADWAVGTMGAGLNPQMSFEGLSGSSTLDYFLFAESGSTLRSLDVGYYEPGVGLSKTTSSSLAKKAGKIMENTPVKTTYTRMLSVMDTSTEAQVNIAISQPKLGSRVIPFTAVSDSLPEIITKNCLQYLACQPTTVGKDDDTLSFNISIMSKNLKTNLQPLFCDLNGNKVKERLASLSFCAHDSKKGFGIQSIRIPMKKFKGKAVQVVLSGIDFKPLGKNLEFSLSHVYKLGKPDTVKLQKEAEPAAAAIPATFGLSQNYPNPFNPSTVLSYQLPAGTQYSVSLRVYDMLGREVSVLADGIKAPGYYTATFDASRLASGVYFTRFTAQPQDGNLPFTKTMKMLMVK